MLGFIGAGNMGGAIIRGVLNAHLSPANNIYISCHTPATTQETAQTYGVTPCLSNTELVRTLGHNATVILAVKPHTIPGVLDEIHDACADMKTLIVSVAAGTSLETLASHLAPNQPIVRTMPNVAASVSQSVTALCPNEHVTTAQYEHVSTIFNAIGTSIRIAEKDFSAYSAIAGCSPAFTFYYIDALARGAVQAGLTKTEAVRIAAQAVRGAADMLCQGLETGATPASLADSVQSPGGTTIAGVVAMEDAGFSASVVRAIQASIARDRELNEK